MTQTAYARKHGVSRRAIWLAVQQGPVFPKPWLLGGDRDAGSDLGPAPRAQHVIRERHSPAELLDPGLGERHGSHILHLISSSFVTNSLADRAGTSIGSNARHPTGTAAPSIGEFARREVDFAPDR